MRKTLQRLLTGPHMMESPRGTKRSRAEGGRNVSPPPVRRKIQSTVTTKTVANFFTPSSKKEPEKISWRVVEDSLLVGRYHGAQSPGGTRQVDSLQKIAGFDFDSTLITSASGLKFARNSSDWKWWHASIPGHLKQLVQDGYIVVILSNQGGISLNSASKTAKIDLKRVTEFKGKVGEVMNQLDIPISMYAATTRDRFRKPRTGMWQELLKDYGLRMADVDLKNSIFVGDAGGRPANTNSGVSKDHACSDRDFAVNVGIAFKTPEEYFLGEEPVPFERVFDPSKYIDVLPPPSTEVAAGTTTFTKKNPLDIVLFCGSPGAGKSTFYWTYLKDLGYERVNQDILKTRDRCLKVASEHLKTGVSVAIDNTNAEPETRAVWIRLAKQLDIPIRCVLFTADAKLCEHNDAVRALNGEVMNPEKRTMLPRVAFTSFAARYRAPTLEEGFQDITKVEFRFKGNSAQQEIWQRFWV